MEISLIKEARESARLCSNFTKRMALRRYADELQDIFGQFTVSCSRQDMQNLVAAWTRVILALSDLPVSPATPTGGRLPVPIEEKLTG